MTKEKVKKIGTVDMLNGPFIPKILSFAVPVMLTGFLQLLYSSADLVVVGQFSEHKNAAQAAISSTSALINLIINLFMGLAVGINVAVAKRIGAKNNDGVKKVIHTSAIVGLIGGVFVGVIGFFFARTFLEWMMCPEDVIDLAALYMKIYFIGAPFNLLYNFFASVLRAKGETKKPFAILAAAGLVNVLLNLIFVIGFKMSVDGVAIATVISQAVSAVLVTVLLIRSPFPFKLSFKDLKVDKTSLADIVKIGLPAGVQGSMFSISNVIIQSTINSFGSIVLAANGNAVSIEGFLNVAVDAVYQATVSFIGQNYGAARKKNIVKISIDAMIVCTAICLFMAAFVLLLRYPLLRIFSSSDEIIEAGCKRFYINVSFYAVFGWMQILVGMLRGLGHGIMPMVFSVLGVCVFRIVWIYTVFPLTKTIESVYWSYPVSWAITALALLIGYLCVKKSTFKRMELSVSSDSSKAD